MLTLHTPIRVTVLSQQFGGGAAEDRDAVLAAEARNRHDVIDRHLVPREWVVGADHDLADPGLGDQMAHPFTAAARRFWSFVREAGAAQTDNERLFKKRPERRVGKIGKLGAPMRQRIDPRV